MVFKNILLMAIIYIYINKSVNINNDIAYKYVNRNIAYFNFRTIFFIPGFIIILFKDIE